MNTEENYPYVKVLWKEKVEVRLNPPDQSAVLIDSIRVLAKALKSFGTDEEPGPTVLGNIVLQSLERGVDQLRTLVDKETEGT